jgi:hypothetical protein
LLTLGGLPRPVGSGYGSCARREKRWPTKYFPGEQKSSDGNEGGKEAKNRRCQPSSVTPVEEESEKWRQSSGVVTVAADEPPLPLRRWEQSSPPMSAGSRGRRIRRRRRISATTEEVPRPRMLCGNARASRMDAQ